jgi:uncharacterized protein
MLLKTLYTFIILIFVINKITFSSDLKLAKDAYNQGNYELAFQYWEPLAIEGNANAQLGLGLLYGKGQGLLQDYKESVKWFKLSADQGNAEAQFYISMAYINGVTYKKNYPLAYMWMSISASRNIKLAKDTLPKFIKMMNKEEIFNGKKLKDICTEKKFINC